VEGSTEKFLKMGPLKNEELRGIRGISQESLGGEKKKKMGERGRELSGRKTQNGG